MSPLFCLLCIGVVKSAGLTENYVLHPTAQVGIVQTPPLPMRLTSELVKSLLKARGQFSLHAYSGPCLVNCGSRQVMAFVVAGFSDVDTSAVGSNEYVYTAVGVCDCSTYRSAHASFDPVR